MTELEIFLVVTGAFLLGHFISRFALAGKPIASALCCCSSGVAFATLIWLVASAIGTHEFGEWALLVFWGWFGVSGLGVIAGSVAVPVQNREP